MSSIGAISTAGMLAAAAQLQASAARVANPASQADLATEAVNQIAAQVSFAANAQVLRAGTQMVNALLDITV